MTPYDQELQAFSRRVLDLMSQRGLSQSDLAREIWGTTQDTRGRDVARNRDRISNYVRGKQMPEASTLKKIADVLGVGVEALNPRFPRMVVDTTGPGGRALPETGVNLLSVGGRSDVQLLVVNKIVPTKLAARIAMLLAEAEDGAL